jgi:hypothetical protein
MGRPPTGSKLAASGPKGIAATAMIWHHAASQQKANLTVVLITREFSPATAKQ